MTTPEQNVSTFPILTKTKVKDLAGQRFGKLLVVSRAANARNRDTAWLCACDCGKTKVVVGYSLTGGRTNSCGKHGSSHRLKDVVGQKFGRLTVVSRFGSNPRKAATWLCVCDCSGETVVPTSHLLSGHTMSCACAAKDRFRSMVTHHGQAHRSGYSGAYKSWANMIKRCTSSKHPFWKNYGGRGITICEKWRRFEGFFEDMGPRPPKLSLDRKNGNDNYEKLNCRWATSLVQGQNQRLRSDSKTGVRGVTIAARHRYKAGITADGKKIHLGYFPLTPAGLEAAKAARLLAEEVYWGGNQ